MSDTSIKSKNVSKVDKPSMYKVIFHNDDYTPAILVTDLLKKYFGKTTDQANAITNAIHKGNKGIAGAYTKDIAETKAAGARAEARTKGSPLKISVEKE